MVRRWQSLHYYYYYYYYYYYHNYYYYYGKTQSIRLLHGNQPAAISPPMESISITIFAKLDLDWSDLPYQISENLKMDRPYQTIFTLLTVTDLIVSCFSFKVVSCSFTAIAQNDLSIAVLHDFDILSFTSISYVSRYHLS